MLELMTYLRANGFRTYIVSGGGIEFMRPWTERVYGIPPAQVVGSSIKTKFMLRRDIPILLRLPQVNFVDDGPGKPVGINEHIGQRPIAAFGNSDGDLRDAAMDHQGRGHAVPCAHRASYRRRARICLRSAISCRPARQGIGCGQNKQLDRGQHERRLGADLSIRVSRCDGFDSDGGPSTVAAASSMKWSRNRADAAPRRSKAKIALAVLGVCGPHLWIDRLCFAAAGMDALRASKGTRWAYDGDAHLAGYSG